MADYDDDFSSATDGLGWGGTVRIPIPGLMGLCVELNAMGFRPEVGAGSVMFLHDLSSRTMLRLEYGSSLRTGRIEFHWNKRRVADESGLSDLSPIDVTGKVSYRAARHFKFGSRTILLTAPTFAVVSIVRASRPPRRADQVIAGWAGAWVGNDGVGGVGEWSGNIDGPIGSTIAGMGGGIIGGDGYVGGAEQAGAAYDWGRDTYFAPIEEVVPEVGGPPSPHRARAVTP